MKTMKTLLAGLLALGLAGVSMGETEKAFDPREMIMEVRLADGRTIRELRIVNFTQSAIVGRWAGGAGAIAYEQFPAELQVAMAEHRPEPAERAERAEPPARRSPAPPANANAPLQLRDPGLKAMDRGPNYVTFGWTVIVYNPANRTKSFRTICSLYDAEGFELEDGISDEYVLRPGESKVTAGRGMIKHEAWDRVERYRVNIRD